MLTFAILSVLLSTIVSAATNSTRQRCRSQPGDPLFPTPQELSQLNSSIDGRLIPVVPSAQFCKQRPGGCTDAEWNDSVFRSNIPGAMLQYNWEQDYASHPPSLCLRNSSVCGQGSVPLFAVNATEAAHIQAGVRFAQKHHMKVAIKASGHDYLGRSTAKSSLLLWTRYLENITFHDSFKVGSEDKGSAVTVGSGVGLHTLYQATKAEGKVFVGGTAANVVPAGGYVQGAGHSALGPLYGLAADNALEFEVVIASGELVTTNEVSHADLFWALRGGGAGSWGVIISVTLRTYPTFDAIGHEVVITANSSSAVAQLVTLHAQHIFDWDDLHAGQYYVLTATSPTFTLTLDSFFPTSSISAVNASMAPFLNAVTAQGFTIASLNFQTGNINDILSPAPSDVGENDVILGSRLISADVFRKNSTLVGETYKKLLDSGERIILGHRIAGGKVSENAKIDSAVHPQWRTAKSHVVIVRAWTDDTPIDTIESIRRDYTDKKVPMLAALAGPGSGAYSNEADLRERAFQTVFFGLNYERLVTVKRAYDPTELFIVGAGVGSENWDTDGLCRLNDLS